MASYLFRQIFHLRKSNENAFWNKKRTAVALQGQIEKIGQQNLGNQLS